MAAAEFNLPERTHTTQYVGARDPALISKVVSHTHKRYEALKRERQPKWDLWRGISEWIDPTDCVFLWNYNSQQDRARKSHGHILNGWARMALEIAGNGLQTGLTPRSRPWFEVESSNPEARTDQESQSWLRHVQNVLRQLLEGSNFYDQTLTNYPRVMLYGQGPLSIRWDAQDVVRFESHEIGSYYLAKDAAGRTDTFYEECIYTTGQMADRYEYSALSDAVKRCLEMGNYDSEVKVIRAIEKNRGEFYDPSSLGWRSAPFRMVDIEVNSDDKERVLAIEPRFNFPVAVPRTKTSFRNPYSDTSPGREALGDVKTLQVDELNKSEAQEQIARPTRQAPSSLEGKADQLRPDETIYVDMMAGQDGAVSRVYDHNPQIGEMRANIQEVQHRIDRHFYRDVFQAISMIERGNVRELEIDARIREQMGQIGPLVESLIPDQNDIVLARVFEIADAMGMIPPAPPLIAGNPLRMNYVSILAQGQRAADVEKLDRWLISAQQMAAVNPTAIHRLDGDAWMKEKAQAIGVPPDTVASDRQVAEAVAAQQAQIERAAMLEEAESMTKSAKQAADAGIDVTNPENAP